MESNPALTPEQNLTSSLSRILTDEPWLEVAAGSEVLSVRSRTIDLSDGKKAVLSQCCEPGDLGRWVNAIEIFREDRTIIDAKWRMEDRETEAADYLEGILTNIELALSGIEPKQ